MLVTCVASGASTWDFHNVEVSACSDTIGFTANSGNTIRIYNPHADKCAELDSKLLLLLPTKGD